MIKSKRFFVAKVFVAVIFVVTFVTFVGLVKIANAETHITEGYLYDDAVWTASGSPYYIEDTVTIPQGRSLTVEAGTSIIGSPDLEGYSLIYNEGDLVMKGQPEDRISISGWGTLSNSNGTTSIVDADISLNEGLNLFGGLTLIASSTISSSTYGIYAQKSDVNISNSRISGNAYGLYVKKPAPPVYMVRGTDPLFGTGGIGNALDEATDVATQTAQINITNSAIMDNAKAAVYNETVDQVHAVGNWWGSKDGPNSIVGPVEYAPWLDRDPEDKTEKTACCSSILFLPGLEASRLYEGQFMPFGLGTSTTRLWEPLSYGNVQSLYLNGDGSSISPSIYAGDLIDIALFTKGIYYKLIRYLDGMVKDGSVAEWEPFAYDWRQPIQDVVDGREKRATTTESLLETVKNLAARSKTGKVTIIAHSNGGLVAKYLVKTLADMGNADFVDKVISVAVPYLGTPQAIPGLLHGSDQSIAFGLVLSEYVARGLGVNMASAYSLLPSKEYFNKVNNPVITFSSSTVTGVNNGSYPLKITDFAGQYGFIADSKNGRMIASTTGTTTTDTALALKGNLSLMDAAQALHDILDPFSWPSSIARWAIVGWNRNTASGVAYSERIKCPASWIGLPCMPRPVHEEIMTPLGDGTVIAPSAMFNAGTVAAVDLRAASAEAHVGIDHSSILESSTTLALIGAMMKSDAGSPTAAASASSSGPTSSSTLLAQIQNIPGVTVGEPKIGTEPTYLVISTHSPVELHVYDRFGNHTGTVPLPGASVAGASVEDGLYTSFEENIPGSNFSSTDEGDSYVYLPDDGQKYEVEIQGTGVGEFTLDVERKRGTDTLQTVEYSMVPTNPLTVASTTVQSGAGASGGSGSGGGASFGDGNSVVAPLSVDEDGNGSPDTVVKPNKTFDPVSYMEMFKKTITAIAGTTAKGKALLKRVDKLEDLIRVGKLKKAHVVIARLDKRMNHLKWKKLNATDKDRILDMFDAFIQQFE
jgi:pimeloyl-ACP methyl ester carboxylesterase